MAGITNIERVQIVIDYVHGEETTTLFISTFQSDEHQITYANELEIIDNQLQLKNPQVITVSFSDEIDKYEILKNTYWINSKNKICYIPLQATFSKQSILVAGQVVFGPNYPVIIQGIEGERGNYIIRKGLVRIDDTNYNVFRGKTMIEGTNYLINVYPHRWSRYQLKTYTGTVYYYDSIETGITDTRLISKLTITYNVATSSAHSDGLGIKEGQEFNAENYSEGYKLSKGTYGSAWDTGARVYNNSEPYVYKDSEDDLVWRITKAAYIYERRSSSGGYTKGTFVGYTYGENLNEYPNDGITSDEDYWYTLDY